MIKYNGRKENAVRFTVNLKGNVEEYAVSLLHIINNAREYPTDLYRVRNTYSNDVYVTCNPDCREDTRKYLSQFGDITNEEDITRFVVDMEYDSYGFDKIYGKDDDYKDVEFYIQDEE